MATKVEVHDFEGEGRKKICSARSEKDICKCPDDTDVLVAWTIRGKIASGAPLGSTSLGGRGGDDRRRFLPSFKFLSNLAFAIDILSMIPEGMRKLAGKPTREKLPDCLEKFKNLKTIHVDNNGLKSLENIEKVKGLEHLSARNNKIKKIIELPPSLKYLSLAGNDIEWLENISNLKDLEFLDASNNKIGSFYYIKDLDSLKILDVSFNNMTDWSLGNTLNTIQLTREGFPKDLESIDASLNGIRYPFPDIETKAAKRPINLILGIGKTAHIDPPPCDRKDVCSCPKNTSKIVARNKGLKRIPSCISKFGSLRVLDMGENNITKVENLENLEYLESVDLGKNDISKFDGFQKNPRLKSIEMPDNNIKAFDPNMASFWNLENVNLEGNDIPKKTCKMYKETYTSIDRFKC